MGLKILVIGNANSIHLWRWCFFLQKAGLKVFVLTPVKLTLAELDYSVFEAYFDYSEQNKVCQLFRIAGFIRQHSFDYINFHYVSLKWALICLLIRQKIILTCLGSDILINFNQSRGLAQFLLKNLFLQADKIFYDANQVAGILQSKIKGLKPGKLQAIFWGIDPRLFCFPRAEDKKRLRRKYHIPARAVVLLSMRNLKKNYQIREIIEWFIKEIQNKAIYLIVRVSPYSEAGYLEQCRSIAARTERIIFIDEPIAYFDMNRLYQLADISLHFPLSDATPVSLLEAVACGNLIIGSRQIDSYRELQKKYCLFLTGLDQMDEQFILKMMQKKNDLGPKNRRVFIENHQQNIVIERLKNIFQAFN